MPASDVVVAGESAGGGLAIALLATLADRGLPQPSCAVVFSPWVDLTLSGSSVLTRAAVDPTLTAAGLRRRAADYVGDANPADGLISPVFADVHGLAPLLIQAGSNEILLDDSVRVAARAAENDVAVTLEVTPGVPHVFQAFAALRRAGSFVRDHLRSGATSAIAAPEAGRPMTAPRGAAVTPHT
jgi:acetyl esterase/lipase